MNVSSVSGRTMGSSPMAEMAQQRAQNFRRADADGSGGLGVDEFKAFVAAGPQRAEGGPDDATLEADFAAFDADGDGSLTDTELEEGLRSKFEDPRSTVERFGGPPPLPEDEGGDALDALLQGLQSGDDRATQIAQRLQQLFAQLAGDGAAASTAAASTTA